MQNLIIYFDGVCYLCNSTVNFLIKIDKEKKFKFSPLQSNFAQVQLKNSELRFEGIDSIIFQKGDDYFIKSNAVIEIIKELKWYWQILLIVSVLPKRINDKLYDLVANNRFKWFGRRDKCMIPTEDVKSRFIL